MYGVYVYYIKKGGKGKRNVKRRKNIWMVGPSESAMVRSTHPGKGRKGKCGLVLKWSLVV